MRLYNHLYKTDEAFTDFMKETGIENSPNILVRIHSATHSLKEMNEVVASIKKFWPCCSIIGCSTSHIILAGEIIHNACLVSVTEFDSASIVTGRISCMSADGSLLSGEALAEKILGELPQGDHNPFMMMFFPVSYSRIEAVVNSFNSCGRSIRLLGGTAYLEEETNDNPCYVISGDKASAMDVAFAYINAKGSYIHTDYACGVEAVGRRSPIKVEGTRIISVDNIPGGEWYSSLLGKSELDKNPSIAESFPLIKMEGTSVPYHVDYKKDESSGEYVIETFPELRNGTKISPGYFHPQKTFDQVSGVIHSISSHPCEALFGYDCYARNALLSDCAKWEIGNFVSTNISGCLLSGEISCRDHENLYANLSFVLASLADDMDSYVAIDPPDVTAVSKLQEENVNSLNFLLSNAMKYMSEELTVQKDMLRDAVFYNPALGIDNQLKYQFDTETERLNKVAVLNLTNEKMLKLFSGVSDTYASLTDCYQSVIGRYGNSRLHFYSYHETSLMLATNDSYSDTDFESLVDDIHRFLNAKTYGDVKLSYIAVSLIDSEDPLSNMELVLDYARSHNIQRIHSEDVDSDLEKEQEKIHMLWIVREAVAHKRVYPYFQEIHSNKPGKKRLFEALMRIKDENGKVYFPDSFLPIAKEYYLYDKLSELMVAMVMDMFAEKEARVTINLNVNDIYNRSMLRSIFNRMHSAKKPQNFVFEIVESEEITDYEYIKSFADRIHEYGGKIAIDDFGSGFSNMLHIMRIDADYIKIDGAIIKEITTDYHVRDFVKFMQTWCENNNQALICEYIENKDIQDMMESYGVAYSQGYYYSKPHPWGPEDE